MSAGGGAARSAGPERGLCPRCRHVELVRTPRGSTFLRCALSRTDPRYLKYPAQPVLACAGFRA